MFVLNYFTDSFIQDLLMNKNEPKVDTIGIPRAISYYNNYPFYYGFLTELGVKIVLSDKTTSKLINTGTKYVVSDTCLPIKVYVGHVINLLEKGVNTIFVPALQSVAYKINNCSKVRGLPEIIRNVIDKPIKIIEPVLDKTENISFKDFCFDFANQLGITDKNLINKAISAGWEKYDNFISMTKNGIPQHIALDNAINDIYENKKVELVKPLSVVIMAHGYNLFDERISLNLIKKIEKMNVKVYTGLNVAREDALKSIQKLDELQYWANELDLTGTAAYYLLNNKVDGIIALSAFGCGPDSLMVDEIEYHAKKLNMPMMHLTIDEHTGEAGFVTRIEAFIDMLERRKRYMNKEMQKLHDKINETRQNKIAINLLK